MLRAGETIVTPLTELTASERDCIIGVNLNCPFYVLKEALAILG
jgi:hypothetical protein